MNRLRGSGIHIIVARMPVAEQHIETERLTLNMHAYVERVTELVGKER